MDKQLKKINAILNDLEMEIQELERRVLELEDRTDHSGSIGY